jgi:hypothetical protein
VEREADRDAARGPADRHRQRPRDPHAHGIRAVLGRREVAVLCLQLLWPTGRCGPPCGRRSARG